MVGFLDDWLGSSATINPSIHQSNIPLVYAGEGTLSKDIEHFPFREHIVTLLGKAWPWHLVYRLPGDLWASSLTPLLMFKYE